MSDLRFTLLSDGSSDEVLIPILIWLLRRHGVTCAIQSSWADLRRLRKPPETLPDKITVAVDLYPCDLLFVHRDAENEPFDRRKKEIQEALLELQEWVTPSVCLVPVRMQEAWLLIEEVALRRAAGNPKGRQPLEMPKVKELELLPDPKQLLYDLLRKASGLYGRRRKKFSAQVGARRVVEFIDDFSLLYRLSAFRALDADLQETVRANRWSEIPDSD